MHFLWLSRNFKKNYKSGVVVTFQHTHTRSNNILLREMKSLFLTWSECTGLPFHHHDPNIISQKLCNSGILDVFLLILRDDFSFVQNNILNARRVNINADKAQHNMRNVNTSDASHIRQAIQLTRYPCIAAPIEPQPSIIAVTVDIRVASPLSDLCCPKSADTAVVIRAYGPFTKEPTMSIRRMFKNTLLSPIEEEKFVKDQETWKTQNQIHGCNRGVHFQSIRKKSCNNTTEYTTNIHKCTPR